MLDLTPPTASKRHKRCIATYPLLTTRGLHQRRLGIATEPAMLAGNGLGVHAIVRHHVSLSRGPPYRGGPPRSLCRCTAPRSALSSWTMLCLPRDHPSPAAACLVQRAPDELMVQSPTQPNAMETQSHAASQSQSLPAQATGSGHTRARPHRHSPQRSPSSPAPAREPEPGTRRPAQGGRRLLGPATLFSRAYRLSRRLTRAESTRLGAWHQESARPANHHQLGHATQHRAPRSGPYAQGFAPSPGTF